MWLLNIVAFLIISIFIALKTKENMAEVFPITTCGLVFVLYVMAYFRSLSAIDFFSIGIVLYSAFIIAKADKVKRGEYIKEVKDLLFHPVTIMILVVVITVSFLVQGRIALWWDDLNFWATDVKSIYYLDGFAGKYGNAAPEFGDYPPGVQLFKWWFLHFNPNEYKEGLMFAGYYTLNVLLLSPLFAKMKRLSNPILNGMQFVFGGICILVLPSVVETFYLEGTCSDLPMGISFGVFLWSVFDEKNHSLKFSYWRQVLSLSLVMICKNTGFQWVIYGLLFLLLYHLVLCQEEGKGVFIRFLKITLIPLVVEVSWLLNCLVKRRVAKLTGAGIKMAVSGVVPNVDYRMELVKNYFQGFIMEPIHRQNTIGIDLSVLIYILLAMVLIVFYKKQKIISKKERNFLIIFFLLMAIISYGITLVAHLTIFVTELQYLEAKVMTASIERYGAPFTIGFLYVVWGIWVTRKHKWNNYAYTIAILSIYLCAQWPGVYNAFWGYQREVELKKNERDAMVEEARTFEEKTKDIWKERGTRVLYMRDGSKNHRVKDTYINYEVAPLGVVYGDITENLYQPDACRQIIEQSHAKYLYADDSTLNEKMLFTEIVEDFNYKTLYEVKIQGETVRLVPMK